MNARFHFLDTPIEGLRVVRREPIRDERGYLERLYCEDELRTLIPGRRIVQINHTHTANAGTVRGMHFQHPPFSETKFVHCLRGEVFDVAVDLRRHSATFLRWHAEILSADNYRTLVIPEGFAHGFQTLTNDCEMLYFHTAPYRPDAEDGLHVEDPRLAIRWPMPVKGLSPRDATRPPLTEGFLGVAT